MTDINFDEVVGAVEEELDAYVAQLGETLEEVGEKTEERVRVWIAGLASKELSLAEFRDLVEGEKDLVVMTALEEKVTLKVLAGAIKNVVLERVLDVVTELAGE